VSSVGTGETLGICAAHAGYDVQSVECDDIRSRRHELHRAECPDPAGGVRAILGLVRDERRQLWGHSLARKGHSHHLDACDT
jgi:hypothetical protein